ncbi:MAG: phosphoglucosamine mutase [Candidatus Neomarinimicrobiota bacterium]
MIIRSISGVRGLVKTHLTEETVTSYAQALHVFLGSGIIMAGRDSRQSGETLLNAFNRELVRLGRNVINCGIVPTPTIQYMVEHSDAAGGIIVTASHNPEEWNGLKFVRSEGTFFNSQDCDDLFSLVDQNKNVSNAEINGLELPDQNSILKHTLKVLSLSCLNLNSIRDRHFKVVVDAVNGAGSEALPGLLEKMGCEVVRLYCSPNGDFPRGAEPLPENLGDLCETVLRENAHVGFAIDPDADRLACVSDLGIPLGEEYTLVLAAEGYMKVKGIKETFVTNLSTSLALEKTAEIYGCRVERSAVGEINVVQRMIEIGAELGGEGNGGVILKEAHLGRDSLVAAALVLNRMSQSSNTLNNIHKNLPVFKIVKDKVNLKGLDLPLFWQKVKEQFQDGDINKMDGLKFTWDNSWIHLRPSNTEPILRI